MRVRDCKQDLNRRSDNPFRLPRSGVTRPRDAGTRVPGHLSRCGVRPRRPQGGRRAGSHGTQARRGRRCKQANSTTPSGRPRPADIRDLPMRTPNTTDSPRGITGDSAAGPVSDRASCDMATPTHATVATFRMDPGKPSSSKGCTTSSCQASDRPPVLSPGTGRFIERQRERRVHLVRLGRYRREPRSEPARERTQSGRSRYRAALDPSF